MDDDGGGAVGGGAGVTEPLVVYAVVYSNYDPDEVVALYRRREDAEADAEVRNARSDWSPWEVAVWEVSETSPTRRRRGQ